MTRYFCDVCRDEVTDKDSSAIHGIRDADDQGNGTTTDAFDTVCRPCYRAWLLWMKVEAASARRPRKQRTR